MSHSNPTITVLNPKDYPDHDTEAIDRSTHAEHIDKIELFKFLLMLFAYGWWAIIVVYYGLLAESASLHYQVMSFPIVIVAFGLARVFHIALNQAAYGFASLFFSGLLVAGMLA
jgi:uncharacterized membrane protein YjjP (DUF1212 family)